MSEPVNLSPLLLDHDAVHKLQRVATLIHEAGRVFHSLPGETRDKISRVFQGPSSLGDHISRAEKAADSVVTRALSSEPLRS